MNKFFFWGGLILSIFIALCISHLYFQIFIYYFPKNLGPGTYDAAAFTYYFLGFVLGVIYFLLIAGYIKLSRLFQKKESAPPKTEPPKS